MPASAADVEAEEDKNISAVSSVEYETVAAEIAAAQTETTVTQGAETIHYYWGDNSFVVHDDSGYYFVEINENFTQFLVNGKSFEIFSNTRGISYLVDWYPLHDFEKTFDVGGLPHSVVGGLIGSAVGSLFSGGTAVVVGAVAGAMAGMFLSGMFPVDYKLTVSFQQMFHILDPNIPVVAEFYEEIHVYGGPSNDLYESELYSDVRTYTETIQV